MSQLFTSRGQSLWSFSFSISPSNEYSGLISFRIDWFDFLSVQGTLNSLNQHYNLKASILQCTAFFTVQLSHPYTITRNTIALITWMFVGKVMSVCSISPTNALLNPTVKGGFSGGTVVKKKKKKTHPQMQETQEIWVQSLDWEDPLEKEMASHSSILTWETPWTEEPGGLQSMESQWIGHDWSCTTMKKRQEL